MELLLLTPQLPFPPHQGTTIRNYNLIVELAKEHTIDLITFCAPGENLLDDSPLFTHCRRIGTCLQPQRSSRLRILDTVRTTLPDMALRLESPHMRNLVYTWTSRHHYQIVQFEGIEMAQYGQLAIQNSDPDQPTPRLIFDNHNCEYLLQKRSALADLGNPRRWPAAAYSLVQWQKLRRYERTVCQQADATVAVSEADRSALLELDPELSVTVVPNGIDLEAYRAGDDRSVADPPTLVFTGKMDYRPNIDAVLWFGRQVFPLIRAQAPSARFQIVGMNPHPRLDELRGMQGIEITGAVPDTRPYIQGATVYLIPMRVGGGTRFKALEAMACAKAIVSTSLGVEGFPIEDGKELILADSPQANATAVLRLIDDAADKGELARQLGMNARRFVEERYGWSQIVPGLEALYE